MTVAAFDVEELARSGDLLRDSMAFHCHGPTAGGQLGHLQNLTVRFNFHLSHFFAVIILSRNLVPQRTCPPREGDDGHISAYRIVMYRFSSSRIRMAASLAASW